MIEPFHSPHLMLICNPTIQIEMPIENPINTFLPASFTRLCAVLDNESDIGLRQFKIPSFDSKLQSYQELLKSPAVTCLRIMPHQFSKLHSSKLYVNSVYAVRDLRVWSRAEGLSQTTDSVPQRDVNFCLNTPDFDLPSSENYCCCDGNEHTG